MTCTTELNIIDQVATITLHGEITTNTAAIFQEVIERTAREKIEQLVLDMTYLTYMSSAGLRVLIFAKQKMGSQVEIFIVGAGEMIIDTLKKVGFHHSVHIVENR